MPTKQSIVRLCVPLDAKHRPPDLLARHRHLDVFDPEVTQRVADGVDDGGG
ncbi:MAG: hypothetical protein CFH10_02010, partial [Alphaproteobacteria bacterium MarineAlpha4_Bin2]